MLGITFIGLAAVTLLVTTPASGAAEEATALPSMTPFLPLLEAPLTIDQSVSTSQTRPGDQLTFRLTVAIRESTLVDINIQNPIDAQLDLLDATSSAGSCTLGATVRCAVQAHNDKPAIVTIHVRVHDDAQGTISNQASASVNGLTAASERQTIAIVAAATPSATAQSSATPAPPTTTRRPTMQPDDDHRPAAPSPTPMPSATIAPSATPSPAGSRRAPVQPAPAIPTSATPPDRVDPPTVEVPF